MSGLITVMIIGLLSIGLVGMLILGDAVAERRSANTAADAAALAAADYCADSLEEAYRRAVRAPDAEGFWAEFGHPVSHYCTAGGVTQAVNRYASPNGATVTGIDILSGFRFRVEARRNDTVNETELHNSSIATARMDFVSGVCVRNGLVGVKDGSVCRTEPEEPEPAPSGNPSADPSPTPTAPPQPPMPKAHASSARIDTRLVTT